MNIDEVVIYLRKSRADSDNESVEEVLARHEQILQEYALRTFGCHIPEYNIYREVVSGETIEARPEFQKVLQAMESGIVKGVIVVEPQRLSRGDLCDCGRVSNTFRYTNTTCYTPTMTYHMDVKHERKFFEAELMRGGEYLDYVKEIMNRGRLLSVQNGNYIGSVAPYGYDRIVVMNGRRKCHTLKPNNEAEVVRKVFELYASGLGFGSIAYELERLGYSPRNSKYWNPKSLCCFLDNPVYIGKLTWYKRKVVKSIDNGVVQKSRNRQKDYVLVDGIHEPIISQDLWDAVQARRGLNPPVGYKKTTVNAFAGILYCTCGSAMLYKAYPSRGISSRLTCSNQVRCNNGSVTYDEFKDYTVNALLSCIEKFEIEISRLRADTSASSAERIKSLNVELRAQEKLEEDIYGFLENGIYSSDEFIARREKVREKKKEILDAIARIESEIESIESYEEKILQFQEAVDALTSDATPSQQNKLLKNCVKRIDYTRPRGNRFTNFPYQCEITLKV